MSARQRLIILGSGFAAIRLLKQIKLEHYDVMLVSPRNHFLYTPLLPSTTVGSIEFRTIVTPIRRARPGTNYRQATGISVDPVNKTLKCQSLDGGLVWDEPFDRMVIGVGADNNTFGATGVREHAVFLRSIGEARSIRDKLVGALETASLPGMPDAERDRLLHLVGVGAGPTGVRFAAELYDLLKKDLARSYPDLVARVKVTLFESSKNLLGKFDSHLREFTVRHFHRAGISVRLGCQVEEVGPTSLRLKGGEVVPCGLVLWCAGYAPTDFVAGLPFEKDRIGRIVTDEYLRVPSAPDIFATGDCACPIGQDYPQLAQVAEQQGKYIGTLLNRQAMGKTTAPFVWKNLGVSSYIGGGEAVVEHSQGKRRFAGVLAYQLWRSTIFSHLVSPKNKILVPIDRLRAAIFGRDMSKF